MAASLDLPPSFIPAPVQKTASKSHMTHLSGATMADFMAEPTIHLVKSSPPTSKRSSFIVANSKRTSMASTTKSQLRQSNHLLIEMLQNIQTELSAHRTIMLDIQHRVSHLEHESNASVNNDVPMTALQALEEQKPKRSSKLVAPEGLAWWEACQNFANNCDPPLSAREFLRTPKRFSGIEWHYGAPATKPNTPPATPPEVDDLPPLTPTSEEGETSDLETPRRHTIDIGENETVTASPQGASAGDVEAGIKEHIVEINKKNIPAPPMLEPAPAGRPSSLKSPVSIPMIETKPLPPIPMRNPQRYYKGVKSVMTYKALLKHTKTEKEHQVLIHFHRKGDLQGIEED
ncbi:hypothetical protein BDV95DRAFT_603436 [Massariosphaeria phaeospora]|uniref:Uncharacterized protein n=1 Tax=Massariosphaeria phaeospora TaxID=100035 RepID=A0A7C8IGV0_9PLEO|nr:hypothetical protein BDV95DRAFT_603436 [Massariosphaeria phaeospora]